MTATPRGHFCGNSVYIVLLILSLICSSRMVNSYLVCRVSGTSRGAAPLGMFPPHSTLGRNFPIRHSLRSSITTIPPKVNLRVRDVPQAAKLNSLPPPLQNFVSIAISTSNTTHTLPAERTCHFNTLIIIYELRAAPLKGLMYRVQ